MWQQVLNGLKISLKLDSSRKLSALLVKSRTVYTSTLHYNKQNQEEMEYLKENAFFAKYADRLQRKADSNPEDFQSAINELELKAKTEQEEARRSLQDEREKQKEQATQKKSKGLDAIVKLKLLKERSTEEITELWKQHHSNKDCVFSVIPNTEYEQLQKRAQEFSTFLYPIPRGSGYEFMMQQFDGHNCHFTPLIMYQRHQENAPPCFTMTHYTELADSKGIVLMNSELDKDIIGVHEAQLLVLQVKMYYGVNSGLKFNLVRLFNNAPSEFQQMDLIKEFEKYKQDCGDYRDGTWV